MIDHITRTLALAVPVAVALAAISSTAHAQPAAFAEQATYGGAGNTIAISRLPIRDSTGKITYKDVRIPLTVSSTGVLTVGKPVVSTSPILLIGSFVAGRYRNGNYIFNVSGPGVGTGGRTTWSIVGPSACSFNAGWTSGPVTGHPSEARLKKVGITYGGVSYGASGDDGCFTNTLWLDALVSASGGPDGLTIFSHTDGSVDKPSPVASLSFTLCKNAACN